MRKILHLAFLLSICQFQFAQDSVLDSLETMVDQAESKSTKVHAMWRLADQLAKTDLHKAIEINQGAKELAQQIAYGIGVAGSLNRLGINYYFLGEYANALIYWQDAKSAYEKNEDSEGVANILSNMGAIYFNQSDYGKALDLYLQALRLAEETNDTMRIGTVLQNIGAVHLDQDNNTLALESFQKAVPFFEAVDYGEGLGLAQLSIGEIEFNDGNYEESILSFQIALEHLKTTPYFSTGLRELGSSKLYSSDFQNGMEYLDSAYSIAEKSDDKFELTRALIAKAKIYEKREDVEKALTYYEEAQTLLENEDRASVDLLDATEGLVNMYALKGDYKSAFENQKLFQSINDSIFNLESDRKIDGLLFNFELEKKQDEIELLIKDSQIKDLAHQVEINRKNRTRNIVTIIGFLIFIFATGLLSRLRFIRKSKASLQKEKDISENLLLNILPEDVAEELKQKGYTDAKEFEQSTILFTDFKGFTSMSEIMSASELIAEIDSCFKGFDHIMEKYGIEKIKTIGDAYMAAGGLHTPRKAEAKDVIKAGLEMQEFMISRRQKHDELGIPSFEMRIGINTGPVIAGVVGVKKFQYDIWGDTVNIASRMESRGEVGKVNISQNTYDLVKDNPQFKFEKRGKIIAKGKGEMEMYFVSKANDEM